MATHRETIDVDEYVDALRTWSFLTDSFGPQGRELVEEACAHLAARHQGVVAIAALCDALTAWGAGHASRMVAIMRVQIAHSCLLSRLIYAGEPLRTERCPIHDGRWSGAFEMCPVGCNVGATLTGWLPNLPASWPSTGTAQLRERLLRECHALDHAGAHAGARRGMAAAIDLVRAPLHHDPRVWLWRVLTALDAVRARFVDPRDDDGWALGGVTTVRNLVELQWREIHA